MTMEHQVAIQARKRQRSVESIEADLYAQRQFVEYLLKLACDFYNCDTRPLLWDGHFLMPVGPDPVPQILRDNILAERTKMAVLELELSEAPRWDRR